MKINLKEIILVPNLISLFRLLLGIPFYFLLSDINREGYRTYILILILIAFISDLLDGFVARKTNSVSEFGKIIDPLADKVLVALIVIYLFILNEIPSYYFYIVILRDILIFTGGIFVSGKLGKVLPSNLLGKMTVFSIGIFIIITLLQIDKTLIYYKLILLISVCLCFASLIGYLLRAFETLKWKKNEHNS
jgi:cardiolipin synthase (CMP-forming)